MLILGIESSCDETAAAIVSSEREILSNIVWSQTEHEAYGGVVPEIAARAHLEHIEGVISRALAEANVTLNDIDAVAATAGPGLIGGVIVGVMTAKAIASVQKKPFIAVNHLEGHALTVRLTNDVPFPYLLLLASGGHCQFLIISGVGEYQKLGGTIDDALGEAFDKVGKMLGLGYPAGAAVEKMALRGNERAFTLPIPLKGRAGCDMSFSGLKTAVRLQIEKLCHPVECESTNSPSDRHTALDAVSRDKTTDGNCNPRPRVKHGVTTNEGMNNCSNNLLNPAQKLHLSQDDTADICASFQYTATLSVLERAEFAVQKFKELHPEGKNFVLSGGVAANQYIRRHLEKMLAQHGLTLVAPPIKLCTDNAAMIAWAGLERFRLGQSDSLDFEPRARWPLG